MLDLICVCKSGGIYDATWVEKLKVGAARHLPPHRFRCLTDIEGLGEPLTHGWDGWWSKIELFKPGVIDRPTLYLDLDTVITGPVDVSKVNCDFAMLQSFWTPDMVGSGVMWFSGENVPTKVYEKFAKQPKAYIAHYKRNADAAYVGDQAFIWDTMNREVERINDYLPGIKSYKMHCFRRLPVGTSIVCFHGKPRPTEVDIEWMKDHWKPLVESDIA